MKKFDITRIGPSACAYGAAEGGETTSSAVGYFSVTFTEISKPPSNGSVWVMNPLAGSPR
jgi:hypothetical protein